MDRAEQSTESFVFCLYISFYRCTVYIYTFTGHSVEKRKIQKEDWMLVEALSALSNWTIDSVVVPSKAYGFCLSVS